MSFSLDVKEELARVSPECSHCNRALMAAYVRVAGALHMQGVGAFSLEVSSDIALVARLLTQILHDEYRLQTEITMRRSVLHKNINYLIDVPAQIALIEMLKDLGFLDASATAANSASAAHTASATSTAPAASTASATSTAPAASTSSATPTASAPTPSAPTSSAPQNFSVIFSDNISPHLVAKACCAKAYVRGVFLASGFVSDPKSNAHFEITFENESLARNIAQILKNNQIPGRVKPRRGMHVLYLKSGAHIVNFLSFSGAHTSALKYEEARVMKSVRSGVNRQINAELANQKRAAVAAVDQVFAARAVVRHYGAGKLTPALQEFIRLRIKYPNASLKELGEHANPPLSKSAVAHRVRRMMQLAQNIKD